MRPNHCAHVAEGVRRCQSETERFSQLCRLKQTQKSDQGKESGDDNDKYFYDETHRVFLQYYSV